MWIDSNGRLFHNHDKQEAIDGLYALWNFDSPFDCISLQARQFQLTKKVNAVYFSTELPF